MSRRQRGVSEVGEAGAGDEGGLWEDVGAAGEEPADRGEGARGGLGLQDGEVEEGEGCDAAGAEEGGGDGEDLCCCGGGEGHGCGWGGG